MGRDSKIEWCHHTFNHVRGCTKVSSGCRFCYAETLSHRNPGVLGIWGPNGSRVVAAEAAWKEPLKWDRAAKAAGERHRVFCASLADVFEEWDGECLAHDGTAHYTADDRSFSVASSQLGICNTDDMHATTLDDVRYRLFDLILGTPNLDWLLLTKRPENVKPMLKRMPVLKRDNVWDHLWPHRFPNVWLGVSVEDQATADARIPVLLDTPARIRFISAEPLLGPIDLNKKELICRDWRRGLTIGVYLDWVIAGGESGPKARPMHPSWVESLRNQCQDERVAFLFKQWGEYGPDQIGPVRFTPVSDRVPMSEPASMFRVGKKAAGRALDGRTWDELPAVPIA